MALSIDKLKKCILALALISLPSLLYGKSSLYPMPYNYFKLNIESGLVEAPVLDRAVVAAYRDKLNVNKPSFLESMAEELSLSVEQIEAAKLLLPQYKGGHEIFNPIGRAGYLTLNKLLGFEAHDLKRLTKEHYLFSLLRLKAEAPELVSQMSDDKERKEILQSLKQKMSTLQSLEVGGLNEHQVEELKTLIKKAQNIFTSDDLNEIYNKVIRIYFKNHDSGNSILTTQLVRTILSASMFLVRDSPDHIQELLHIAKDFSDTDSPVVLIADSILAQGHIKILNSEQKRLVYEIFENHFKKALSFGRFFDTQETEIYRLENYLFLSRAMGLPPKALVDLLNLFITNNKVSPRSLDTYVAFMVRLLEEIMRKHRAGPSNEKIFIESTLINIFKIYINGNLYKPYDSDHYNKTSPFRNELIKNMDLVYRDNIPMQEKMLEILSSSKQVIYPLLEDLSPIFNGSTQMKNSFQHRVTKKVSAEILNFAISHRSVGFQGESDVRLKSFISMIGELKEYLTPQDFYDELTLIISKLEHAEKLVTPSLRMASFEFYAPYRYLLNMKQSFNESLVNISPQNRCQLLLRFRL